MTKDGGKVADKKQAEVAVDAAKLGGVDAPAVTVDADGESSKNERERMLLEKVSSLEAELKKLITQRDELKNSVDEIEAQKLSETQKYKEAFEKIKPEYDELLAFKKTHDGRIKDKLEGLEKNLANLSKEDKAEFEKFIKKLAIEDRIDWLDPRVKNPPETKEVPKPPSSPGANDRPGLDAVVPERSLNPQELLELKTRNPVAYQDYLRKVRDAR